MLHHCADEHTVRLNMLCVLCCAVRCVVPQQSGA
jgi:hypothetical protein